MCSRLLQFVLLLLTCSAQYGYTQSNYLGHSLLRAYNSILNAEVNGIIKRERQNTIYKKQIYSIDGNQKINAYTGKEHRASGRVARLSDLPVQNRNKQTSSYRSRSNKELNKVGWETF